MDLSNYFTKMTYLCPMFDIDLRSEDDTVHTRHGGRLGFEDSLDSP